MRSLCNSTWYSAPHFALPASISSTELAAAPPQAARGAQQLALRLRLLWSLRLLASPPHSALLQIRRRPNLACHGCRLRMRASFPAEHLFHSWPSRYQQLPSFQNLALLPSHSLACRSRPGGGCDSPCPQSASSTASRDHSSLSSTSCSLVFGDRPHAPRFFPSWPSHHLQALRGTSGGGAWQHRMPRRTPWLGWEDSGSQVSLSVSPGLLVCTQSPKWKRPDTTCTSKICCQHLQMRTFRQSIQVTLVLRILCNWDTGGTTSVFTVKHVLLFVTSSADVLPRRGWKGRIDKHVARWTRKAKHSVGQSVKEKRNKTCEHRARWTSRNTISKYIFI